jgi:cell division protein FtsI/penicillin-binding protein 2
MKIRLTLLTIGTACAFLLLGGTLYTLQVMHADTYAARAQAQQMLNLELAPERGTIAMRDKSGRSIPLALNQDFQIIFAAPKEIDDISEVGSRVATLLNVSAAEVIAKLKKSGSGVSYRELVNRATDEQVAAIESAQIKGVYTSARRGRKYPFGQLASQVVGFVNQKEVTEIPEGQYGVEASYNGWLTGTSGSVIEDGVVTPPQAGKDIQLTIDQNIQARAEEILHALVKEKNAIGGTVIVEEPSTGKILAMANDPSFDPNEYNKSPLETFLNPAVQGLYEPGSVFKPITMAIGLDTGAITPEMTYYDPGYFTADGKTIKNWDLKEHGTLTMTNVIEQSINTGTVFAEKKIGHKTFYEYLVKFGIKDLTGITLPGETGGRLTPLEKYPRDINFATASYGQGVAVTPIRLLAALSTLANAGEMREPYIVEGAPAGLPRKIITAEAAAKATRMMVSAVQKAKIADIPNYTVAGKTGTAFKPDFKNGGYTDKVINTYIGFAPASKPRFIALIKLDEPENAPLAGTTVVPAFRELAEFILNYYTIPPDRQ